MSLILHCLLAPETGNRRAEFGPGSRGTSIADPPSAMKRHALLLVEVDPQVCGAYELFLSARGYHVRAASTVGSALQLAAGKRPVAAVIGSLPDTTDIDSVVRRLRALVSPHPLTVIVLSPFMSAVPAANVVIPRGAHPRALLDALRTGLQYTDQPRYHGRGIRPT
jgi:hypothetical protein